MNVVRFVLCLILALAAYVAWASLTAPPPTPAQMQRDVAIANARQKTNQYKKYLCLAAAACKKYDTVRLECATAGSFKTCLHIKMGDDANYIDACSSGDGSPALPSPPDTPTVIDCLILAWF
jgi:hypothetical protein